MIQLRYLIPYLRPYWFRLFLTIVLATTSVVLDHISPWLLKILIDVLMLGSPISKAYSFLVFALFAVILSGLLGYWQRILIAQFSRKMESSLRHSLFQRFLNQPYSFFANNTPGHLLQNLVQDLDRVQELTGPAVLHFYRTGLTLIISTVLLYMLSPSLAIGGFLFFLFLAWASLRLMGVVYQGHRKIQQAQGSLGGFIRDYLHGVQTIKASGNESFFAEKLKDHSLQIREHNDHIAQVSSLIWPAITLVCGLGIAGSIAWGSLLVREGQLTVGALAAATLYLVRAQYPLVGLGIMAAMVQRGRASLDRIIEISSLMSPIKAPPALGQKPPFQSIQLQDLQFAYASDNAFSLQHISLDLKPGKSLAIVGDTGSGKTTLLKLICGILPAPQNQYTLNGRDFKELQLDEPHGAWRDYFGYAPQDGFLFSWTISQNIAFGTHNSPTLAQIERASQQAGLEKDLHSLEDHLESVLGEKGVNLSGGQRQRVGLARAFLAEAPILVLDDVFSAVDPHTEGKILESLKSMGPQQALLIVSHRYSAIQHCDEILYLENGCIVERGTHESLLQLNGLYARSWHKQIQQEMP